MTASICPVCHGRGFMSSEFYASLPGTCTGLWDVACRSCDGKGVAWPGPVSPYGPVQWWKRPYDPTEYVIEPVIQYEIHAI